MKHTCETSGCAEIWKTCKKCGEDKPLIDFTYRPAGSDGHRHSCKACTAAYRKAHHERNREKYNNLSNKWYWDNIEVNRAKSREYGAANREKARARGKAWRQANPERYRAKNERWATENPERRAAWLKSYYKDKWANDPEFRHRQNAKKLRRKRLLAGAVQETYTRLSVFEKDGWVCQLCGGAIDPSLPWPDRMAASVDHIVPISLGGDDTFDNVQAAHSGCNSSKGNRVNAEGAA